MDEPGQTQNDVLEKCLEQRNIWLESWRVHGTHLVLNDRELYTVFKKAGGTLSRADLRKAEVSIDLQDADLSRADLREADLTNAIFWNANLRNADLTGATGLLPNESQRDIHPLSGADLGGAKLPDDVAKFPALENVAELSKNAGALFLSLITGDAFIQLIVAKTTDLQLLTNSGTTTIPFINAEIPTTTLFWLGPLLLLVNFIALHLYLQRLWELMSSLPAVFPDGLLLTQKSYPWLVNDIVRVGFPQLKKRKQALGILQQSLFKLLIYAVVPLSLFPIW